MQDHDKLIPTTIKEVGIHVGYMRADMKKMQAVLENLPSGFATKSELLSINDDLVELKTRINTLRYITPIIYGVIGSVVTFLLIDFLNN